MTAPNGAIVFNNSTGSDTTASGLGAANVYGSGASTTGSSAVVTGIDTTGVSSGDLLWVQSSSGRQFSIIATVDSSTQVTCDDVFANTESGRTWAIGGKRAGSDLSTDAIFTEAPDGSTIEIEYTGTDYVNSAAITPSLGSFTNPVTIKGTGSQSPRIVSPATSRVHCVYLNAGSYIWENLQFICNYQSGSPLSVFQVYQTNYIRFENCSFRSEQSSSGSGLFTDLLNATHVGIFNNCLFDGNNLSQNGFLRNGGTSAYPAQTLINCTFKDINGTAVYLDETRGTTIRNCIVRDCNDGVDFKATSYWQQSVSSCVFYNLSGSGIKFNRSDNVVCSNFTNNIFHSITGNAFSAAADYSSNQGMSVIENNAFYSITGSNYSNLNSGTNDITLTADPFVDAANGDFNINSNGGATLRANNYAINTDTSVYPFRQYVSDDFDSGAGGGATVHPLYAN
jgi:hypothetical protein